MPRSAAFTTDGRLCGWLEGTLLHLSPAGRGDQLGQRLLVPALRQRENLDAVWVTPTECSDCAPDVHSRAVAQEKRFR
jgi:hypothetical protein